MGLFEYGTFTLHSGGTSNFLIDCDSLTNQDLWSLAQVVANKFKFGQVYGIPRGGMRLAKKLDPKAKVGHETLLIVDDVWTTGVSMGEAKAALEKQHDGPIQGVVIFARSTTPYWVWPIFQARVGS